MECNGGRWETWYKGGGDYIERGGKAKVWQWGEREREGGGVNEVKEGTVAIE